MLNEYELEPFKKNEAKIETLKNVYALGSVTAKVIGLLTNRTDNAASMGLYRYYRQGLLSRETGDFGKTLEYTLTEKGRARLEWLTRFD